MNPTRSSLFTLVLGLLLIVIPACGDHGSRPPAIANGMRTVGGTRRVSSTQTDVFIFAALPPSAQSPRLYENFVNTGLPPTKLSGGVMFRTGFSGRDDTFYTQAIIAGGDLWSNHVKAGAPPVTGALALLEPATGAQDVSRAPTFRWEPAPDADSYLLFVADANGLRYVLETERTEWTVDHAGPIFYHRAGGAPLDPHATYAVKVFALLDGWACEESNEVVFTTGQ